MFLCAPPKCGGTALYCAALGIDPSLGRHVFSTAQGLTEFYEEPGEPAFMAVRDPIDRFGSLWRDKCRDGDENMPELQGMTPELLMDIVEREPQGNAHWMPQRYWWREGVQIIDFREISKRLGLPTLSVNVTEPDHTPLPIERIVRHYHMDFELIELNR
jgi:hypothetical protein